MNDTANPLASLPLRHIAIIMDGNARWAKQRQLPLEEGHKRGGLVAWKIAEAVYEAQVRYLTLFAFSEENWRRGTREVKPIMNMASQLMEEHREAILEKGLKFRLLGKTQGLPEKLAAQFFELERLTEGAKKGQLNLAFNYSSREEIAQAARACAEAVAKGTLDVSAIAYESFSNYLYTRETPDPDLVIRTSGEMRLSNFLLCQSAYSELYFVEKFWPDFTREDLAHAMEAFRKRRRRFGKR